MRPFFSQIETRLFADAKRIGGMSAEPATGSMSCSTAFQRSLRKSLTTDERARVSIKPRGVIFGR